MRMVAKKPMDEEDQMHLVVLDVEDRTLPLASLFVNRMFAGKNFLQMKPPPGYIPGAGRGAVGFSTDSIRSNPHEVRNPRHNVPYGARSLEQERFVDADEEADEIYAMIDRKRRRKHQSKPVLPELNVTSEPLGAVSMDEWLQLPEPQDSTKRNKRLRNTSKQHMRFYNASDQLALTQEDIRLADLERKRPMLESMVKHQPDNEEGYLQLADLEIEFGKHSKAKSIVMKGIVHCTNNERLWLKALELHDAINALSLAAKACTKLPKSELLWLRRIELTPTPAEKLVLVHEALLTCVKSEQLWLLAADLETDPLVKQEVINTAQKFVPIAKPSTVDTAVDTAVDSTNNDSTMNSAMNTANTSTANMSTTNTNTANANTTNSNTANANTTNTYTSKGNNMNTIADSTNRDSTSGMDAMDTANTTSIANTMADTEIDPSAPVFVRRAALSKATRQTPHSPDLWIARIECEIQDSKPIKHILAEALHHNPRCGRLWVMDLQSTEHRYLKKKLADALKISQGAKEVLEFGANYFQSVGNMDLAKKWQSRLAQL